MSGTTRLLFPLIGAVVLLTALFRVTPRAPRRRLRRSVVLLVVYAAVLAALWVASLAGARPGVRSALAGGAETLEILIIVNLAALTLFDFLLHVLRWDYPDILHDLVVGAAYLVAFGWVLHRAGVDFTGIVATSAVVTAVIGLSLQATLGNVVGGIALQLDDSFQEGDWVELENKTQGQVKQIRWRHTVIETRDWDTLIVPNSQLLTQTIKVLGRRGGETAPHRMWVHFGVDFRYPPARVIQAVSDALAAAPIPNAARDPAPNCICFDLGHDQSDSVAHYAVRYWLVDMAADDTTSSRVRERIYAALRRAQIPLAVPAATLFLSQDDPDHAERKRHRERAMRVSALDDTVLFARLSREEKIRLADSALPAPFSAGEIITRQGSEAHWLYILTRGEAEVRITAPDGQEQKVAELRAPGIFGEMALMTGAAREATVLAKTDLECLRLDKANIKEILAQRPEIAQEMSTLLAQRRVELSGAKEDLDSKTKQNQMVNERGRILQAIRDFFGLTTGN